MGTNYFIIHKDDYKLSNKLWKMRNNIVETENLSDSITNYISNKLFKSLLNYTKSQNLDDVLENYNNRLSSAVSTFVGDITYDVSYAFDYFDTHSIHIGKSSAGWLFNFQIQDTELHGYKVKWISYKQVMDFLKVFVSQKKLFYIVDEYNRKITYKQFKSLVDTKQKDKRNLDNPDNFCYCMNIDGYRFSKGDFS